MARATRKVILAGVFLVWFAVLFFPSLNLANSLFDNPTQNPLLLLISGAIASIIAMLVSALITSFIFVAAKDSGLHLLDSWLRLIEKF